MDIVYAQPLKELLQLTIFFNEETSILVTSELQETKAKQRGLNPIYLVDKKTDIQKIKNKKKAVYGGSVENNEFATKIKADYLLQPSNTKQFFDLGLAKKLSDNNSTVVLMFEELLGKNSFERHLYWKNYLEVAKYCKKQKTNFMVASGCKEFYNVKAPKIRANLEELLVRK